MPISLQQSENCALGFGLNGTVDKLKQIRNTAAKKVFTVKSNKIWFLLLLLCIGYEIMVLFIKWRHGTHWVRIFAPFKKKPKTCSVLESHIIYAKKSQNNM